MEEFEEMRRKKNKIKRRLNKLCTSIPGSSSSSDEEPPPARPIQRDKYLFNPSVFVKYKEQLDANAALEKQRLEEARSERLENERLEKERLALEQIEKERLEQIEKERLEQIEKERLEQIEKERLEQIEKERLEKIEKEKQAKQRRQQEEEKRIELEKLEQILPEKEERQQLNETERLKRNECSSDIGFESCSDLTGIDIDFNRNLATSTPMAKPKKTLPEGTNKSKQNRTKTFYKSVLKNAATNTSDHKRLDKIAEKEKPDTVTQLTLATNTKNSPKHKNISTHVGSSLGQQTNLNTSDKENVSSQTRKNFSMDDVDNKLMENYIRSFTKIDEKSDNQEDRQAQKESLPPNQEDDLVLSPPSQFKLTTKSSNINISEIDHSKKGKVNILSDYRIITRPKRNRQTENDTQKKNVSANKSLKFLTRSKSKLPNVGIRKSKRQLSASIIKENNNITPLHVQDDINKSHKSEQNETTKKGKKSSSAEPIPVKPKRRGRPPKPPQENPPKPPSSKSESRALTAKVEKTRKHLETCMENLIKTANSEHKTSSGRVIKTNKALYEFKRFELIMEQKLTKNPKLKFPKLQSTNDVNKTQSLLSSKKQDKVDVKETAKNRKTKMDEPGPSKKPESDNISSKKQDKKKVDVKETVKNRKNKMDEPGPSNYKNKRISDTLSSKKQDKQNVVVKEMVRNRKNKINEPGPSKNRKRKQETKDVSTTPKKLPRNAKNVNNASPDKEMQNLNFNEESIRDDIMTIDFDSTHEQNTKVQIHNNIGTNEEIKNITLTLKETLESLNVVQSSPVKGKPNEEIVSTVQNTETLEPPNTIEVKPVKGKPGRKKKVLSDKQVEVTSQRITRARKKEIEASKNITTEPKTNEMLVESINISTTIPNFNQICEYFTNDGPKPAFFEDKLYKNNELYGGWSKSARQEFITNPLAPNLKHAESSKYAQNISGLLKIDKYVGPTIVQNYCFNFMVHEGAAEIYIIFSNDDKVLFTCEKGGSFYLPQNCTYFLKNLGQEELQIFYSRQSTTKN